MSDLERRLREITNQYEARVPNGTFVREIETGNIYKIVDSIETDNRWGYGVYLYRFEDKLDTGFGLYRHHFDIMKDTKVISGFPAVGKSFLTLQSNFSVLDSDSSNFSWSSEGVRNPDFPNNYIKHIQDNLGKVDYILVSSHDIVRNALKENNIKYTLVYPSVELKDEYLKRYRKRGNPDSFINFIDLKWEDFIGDIENETFPKLIKLNSGDFLSDVGIDELAWNFNFIL